MELMQNDAVTSIYFGYNFFSENYCDEIVSSARVKSGSVPTLDGNFDMRKVTMHVMSREVVSDITNKILSCAAEVNMRHFGFDLVGIPSHDPPNLYEYNIGDKYDWHFDMGLNFLSTRKLSYSIQLSDENDYEGGDLEFLPEEKCDYLRKKGTLCLFPSYRTHRVTELTKGTRFCIVGWIHGNSYK